MESLLQVLRKTVAYFEKRGLENPRVDAEWIFAHALGMRRLDLYLQFERPMQSSELDQLRPLVARRGQREPLQYVLGSCAFHDFTLKVDRRVLIPRPETEELVEGLCRSCQPLTGPVLDLGTGSGAIACAVARSWPTIDVVATDRDASALELAQSNVEQLGLKDRVRLLAGEWWQPVKGMKFEYILANPPYLTSGEWQESAPEVRDFEPRTALVAEENGLADLQHIIDGAPEFLTADGMLVLETGISQHEVLCERALKAGFKWSHSYADFHGRPRYLVAGLSDPAPRLQFSVIGVG